MKLGSLTFLPIAEHAELVAKPVQNALKKSMPSSDIHVTGIDPDLSDTAEFCKRYDISLEVSTNCIIVEAKRADRVWYAACLIMATDMIDINSKVRKLMDARKVSFAPKDTALRLTDMEFGGITPIGLPESWPIYIDSPILKREQVVIGAGLRSAKILINTKALPSGGR